MKKLNDDEREVQEWLGKIAAYEREFKRWEGRAEKIVKIYRDFDSQTDTRNGTTSFNILWSNVQTCVPAVFARLPKPDVSRRFRDNDPVGRVASMLIERCLEFEIEHNSDYRSAMEGCVLDRFLGGRGIAWVRYEPHFKAAAEGSLQDGVQITEDADESEATPEAQEEIDYECAPVDYVHYKDFGHTVARTWEEVTAVWRKVYLGRAGLVERFGEELGYEIPLDTKPEEQKKAADEDYQACIFEIWDKSTNQAIWLSKSMGRVLDKRDDPLELENFFPCPRPLYATTTTENLIPIPDYKLYQDQAKELNTLADRIDGLIRALQVKGVHDAAVPELARLFKEAGNGDMIPVKNWAAFSEKNGLKGAIDLVDIAPIATALVTAYEAVDKVKQQIYEIMGIADILRGSSDPNETLGAQKLKGQFGSLRLRAMQAKVVQFATELLQIKAEIICKHYQPETILQIGAASQLAPVDQQIVPAALQLIKTEPLRNFRIEVSSDSMVEMDEQQEKADRVEFLKAAASFLQQAVPAAQANPEITPLLMDMLKFGVQAFKVGKSLEGEFDQFADKAREMAQNPQPKPDPAMAKVQADSQARQQEMQMKAQLDQQSMQMQMQLEAHKQEMQAQQVAHQNQLEAERNALAAQADERLEQMRMMHEAALEQSRQQFELLLNRLNNAAKVEVAEVGAATTLQAAQISAANQASEQ